MFKIVKIDCLSIIFDFDAASKLRSPIVSFMQSTCLLQVWRIPYSKKRQNSVGIFCRFAVVETEPNLPEIWLALAHAILFVLLNCFQASSEKRNVPTYNPTATKWNFSGQMPGTEHRLMDQDE